MNHLNMDASQAISSWYRKETYLKAYSHFIQLVPNMEMWPQSRNPIVKPPEARKMLGRPPKNRRREIGEVRKAGKLSRMGTVMTYSICRGANHNKRNCPKILNLSLHQHPLKRGRGQYERASSSNTGTRRGAVSDYKKRPRVVGQGVFVADSGYTCINSSAHVTGNIGFKPT
ncbi:uncharacterized protein [Solanum tuberosum]|uniref:Uncharacterized protein n=1 Tax=Solanum tuberosum TaxID=4113 RepID=M1CXS4_SOLTU|nr:PREDICTED: uncharacterized protein LOC102598112 isoform X2 [Solanum tuberosum]